MKCRSVACIWSANPPLHRVTATAVLNDPPTLYTGGYDGSIIRWNLSSLDSKPEIKPVAMLCGHATPISDIGICNPVDFSGNSKAESSSNTAVNSNLDNGGALISACSDGVLCIWSRGSGHCRRRRKLPPWVGSPSIIRRMPLNSRYVCISCCFRDPIHMMYQQSVASSERGESTLERESQYSKPSKFTVIIVDTYTLDITQTIFHGNLNIGPLKFMDVTLSYGVKENKSALIADSYGRLLLFPISQISDPNQEGGSGLNKSSSQSEMALWDDGLGEGGQVSFATHGNVIAIILKNRCIFRQVADGATIGEFYVNSLQTNGMHVIGGMFLEDDLVGNTMKIQESQNELVKSFAVWNNRGCAIVYLISYLDDIFKYEPIFEIPAASHPLDVRLSISFLQLNCYLLRVESVCCHVQEPLQWKPWVTIWSVHKKYDEPTKLVGESFSFLNWNADSSLLHELEGKNRREIELTSQESHSPSSKYINYQHLGDDNSIIKKGSIVSSSMVITENFHTPYAIVYGFHNGEIEVVHFDVFHSLDSHGNSPRYEVDSHVSRQYLLGHSSAVLCLASHQMVRPTQGWSSNRILLSGSVDCTIRVWDLGSGNLIMVMHQHVAPVRQIILPPAQTNPPWNDCFLSVGEDSCVALASLQTLRVERMFPGHPSYPANVLWDSLRGYIVCLCQKLSGTSDVVDVLYIWDIKTGARERVLRGTASHSMFEFFSSNIKLNSCIGTSMNENTSVSSPLLPATEEKTSHSPFNNLEKQGIQMYMVPSLANTEPSTSKVSKVSSEKLSTVMSPFLQIGKHPIKCSSPFPGIVTLSFDLRSLMFLQQENKGMDIDNKQEHTHFKEHINATPSPHHMTTDDGFSIHGASLGTSENDWIMSLEESILRFSLSFLHLWNVDYELDNLLVTEMRLKKPEYFIVASGLQGDKGSLTLTFPGLVPSIELWKSSSEFSAMRSLTMVSLAQRMISLSQSSSAASRALAAFYTRNFAEKIRVIKPPLLQLLVSFWQDESEHVRMAARSLFHCAASRAIPHPLCSTRETNHGISMKNIPESEENGDKFSNVEESSTNHMVPDQMPETERIPQLDDSNILAWLESYEMQDWISCVGGTSQDAMTSHIIIAAALSIWYPSLVKPTLAMLVVHPLMKLVMAMNEKYSSTAAELLAEGMESTWKACIGSEIPRLIGDILFQIECVSGAYIDLAVKHPSLPVSMQETLNGVLLPSLAMADIPGFLTVVESQIWSTASDSPVHVVSLMTLIRVVRSTPRNLAQFLDKVINFILQTMDPSNSVMRKTCLQSSMAVLKEVVRVFPMVALNDASTRLAVGDAIGDINHASIRVYDMQSVTKIKILDASGPPGLPSLLAVTSETMVTAGISALSFSPDGEGLVAFSEHGLMIRWWSLGSVWWEKLSRNYVPVQCTKLIFVPPWEGFSPNSFRSSIMTGIMGHEGQIKSPKSKSAGDTDNVKVLILNNIDLSYRLEWLSERKVLLTSHTHELGIFLL